MSRYPNDSRSSPTKPSPHGFDDRKRGSAHYPQLYDPVDHNGGQVSPTRSAGGGMEVPISQQGQSQVSRSIRLLIQSSNSTTATHRAQQTTGHKQRSP
jgi:hypothetical protein